MSTSGLICEVWLLWAALAASGVETGLGPNLFTLDRMGAGVPAGWRLTGKKYEWTAEHLAGAGGLATAIGSWEVDSSFTGPLRLATTATLIADSGRWRLVALSICPQSPSERQ